MNKEISIAFFGTSEYSVMVLDALAHAGMKPKVVIAQPDKPKGRKLIITPPPTKLWTEKNSVPVLQPEKLKDEEFINNLSSYNCNLFIVVAYGKIIPDEVLKLPKHGTLNVHASHLPKLRGASPIETAILTDDKNTGVTIILVDNEMDHGPIIASENVSVSPWPPKAKELGNALVEAGAKLLVKIIPEWIAGTITPKEQDHSKASFTKKIEKADGEINLSDDPYKNFLKIQAYSEWPTAYFFIEKKNTSQAAGANEETRKIRVIIKKAKYENGVLEILRVVPEGKKEMDYAAFKASLASAA